MLRVRTSLTGPSGTPWLSTAYFNGDDSQTGANNANAAVGAFWGSIDNNLRNTVSWSTAGAVDELSLGGVLTGSYSVTPQSGVGAISANQALPFATQAMIVWETGSFIGGRRLRGRTYIPGLTEAANEEGIMNSGVRDLLDAAAETLRQTTSPQFVVWSRASAAVSTVASATVPLKWAVLRSRRD